jgi:hypothetical protein
MRGTGFSQIGGTFSQIKGLCPAFASASLWIHGALKSHFLLLMAL